MFSLYSTIKAIAQKLQNVLHQSDVINNLTSTSTTQPLSANQGKVLKGQIDTIDARDTYSASEHIVGTYYGKPLYRRTIYSNGGLSGSKVIDSTLKANDVAMLVKWYGSYRAYNAFYAIPYVDGGTYYIRLGISADGVWVGGRLDAAQNETITIEYTRTRD